MEEPERLSDLEVGMHASEKKCLAQHGNIVFLGPPTPRYVDFWVCIASMEAAKA